MTAADYRQFKENFFMRIAKPVRACFVLSFLAIAVLLGGCNKAPGLKGLYPVKGKLTWDGNPVAGASIMFSPTFTGENARAAGAVTNANGEFTIQTLMPDDGVYPGEYLISVSKRELDKVYTEEELAAAAAKNISLPTSAHHVLPTKYANGETSGFKVTVVAGKNEPLLLEMTGK